MFFVGLVGEGVHNFRMKPLAAEALFGSAKFQMLIVTNRYNASNVNNYSYEMISC